MLLPEAPKTKIPKAGKGQPTPTANVKPPKEKSELKAEDDSIDSLNTVAKYNTEASGFYHASSDAILESHTYAELESESNNKVVKATVTTDDAAENIPPTAAEQDVKKSQDAAKDKDPLAVLSTDKIFEIAFVWFANALYGVGNGVYLAVDLALAIDCLPNKEKAAQSLGIWGVSAFIGLSIGPMLWGSLLEYSKPEGSAMNYPYLGYAWLLYGGMLCCLAAGLTVKMIKRST